MSNLVTLTVVGEGIDTRRLSILYVKKRFFELHREVRKEGIAMVGRKEKTLLLATVAGLLLVLGLFAYENDETPFDLYQA